MRDQPDLRRCVHVRKFRVLLIGTLNPREREGEGGSDYVGRKGRRETSLRAFEFNADVTDAVIGLVVGLLARRAFHLIRFDKVTNRHRS